MSAYAQRIVVLPAAPRTASHSHATLSYSHGMASVCVVWTTGRTLLKGERAQLLTKAPRAATWRDAGAPHTLNAKGRACWVGRAAAVRQFRWRLLGSARVTPSTSNAVRVVPRRR